jgi:acyl carrier protein
MTDPLLAELAGIFADVTGSDPPSPEADLVEGGILDSLALVELLFAIEQELGVEIPPDRLEVARFRTLVSLAELVAECRAVGTSDAA